MKYLMNELFIKYHFLNQNLKIKYKLTINGITFYLLIDIKLFCIPTYFC